MAQSSSETFPLFIGGSTTPGASGEWRPVLDPASNQAIGKVAVGHADDARHAMEVAEKAFRESGWAGDDGSRRAKVLFRIAQALESRGEEFARLETRNMGKTLRESKGDIGYVVRTLEYVAGLADKLQGETIPVPGPRFDYTLREPLGVTVHIAPWNYPLLLALRSVIPALAAGNAAVLKPASLTPLTALAFAKLAKEAGLPDGLLNVVVGSGGEVGEALIDDPRCRSVSFTGSLEVGREIAERAARRLVPSILELGGKSPVVVFADADLDRAAKQIGFGIFGNAGQMCWAGSRLIVARQAHDELVGKVASIAQALRLGPGLSAESEMGPLVSRDHRERVLSFVESARADGARVVSGGSAVTEPPLAEGNFMRPTVLTDLAPSAKAVQQEIFGPVLSVLPFDSPEEAVKLANDTVFGLFAAIWTRDLGTAHRVAAKLDAGMVSVNEAPNTYPQLPFGGFKESGLGFEQGIDTVLGYTRRKNVLLHLGATKSKG